MCGSSSMLPTCFPLFPTPLPYKVKLKWFQIRLLHRILATNTVLKEVGVAQDVLCNFCNLERDSIQRCMWRCQHVKLFWNKIEGFICDHCNNVHNFKFNGKISSSVQMIILKVTMFLILLFCMQNILSIVADMKKSNLSYVHLERSWKKDTKLKHTTKSWKWPYLTFCQTGPIINQ